MRVETGRDFTKKTLEIGDIIVCKGIKAEIAEIYYQDYWDGHGFNCEFEDTRGVYRNWKQEIDGGEVISK